MSNPFDRNKTKEAKLGELIQSTSEVNQRDAVHIAVVPVIAHKQLRPAEAVGVTADGTMTSSSTTVGIVDPFLVKNVEQGQTFWLFLFQGSVTTLRHEWTHSAFPASISIKPPATDDSIAWLKEYASQVNHYLGPEDAYRTLMEDLHSKYVTYHGTDMHGRGDLIDEVTLKHHAEIVLGYKIDFGEFDFSCTC